MQLILSLSTVFLNQLNFDSSPHLCRVGKFYLSHSCSSCLPETKSRSWKLPQCQTSKGAPCGHQLSAVCKLPLSLSSVGSWGNLPDSWDALGNYQLLSTARKEGQGPTVLFLLPCQAKYLPWSIEVVRTWSTELASLWWGVGRKGKIQEGKIQPWAYGA